MPEFICEFENCRETDTPITVTAKGNYGVRARFCSFTHLARWAEKQATRRSFHEREKQAQGESRPPHAFTPSEIHPDTCGICGKYERYKGTGH